MRWRGMGRRPVWASVEILRRLSGHAARRPGQAKPVLLDADDGQMAGTAFALGGAAMPRRRATASVSQTNAFNPAIE